MIEEAQAHFSSGNFAEAEVLYRKMLEEEPDNPEVLYMLSLTRQGQDDLEEPVELLNHAIRVQPLNPSLQYALGTLQTRRNQLPEAEIAFHKAAGMDPNFAAAQNGIALVELTRGRFAAAEHALRKALKSDPQNPQALVNMGIAVLEQSRAGEAIVWLQQVAGAQPENVAAQLHLGRAFLASDNAAFATQCFENALRLKPGTPEILQWLGKAQLQSGQFANAASSFRRLLDKGFETAEIMAGYARALLALKRDREASGALLRALRLNNGDESLLLDYAELQLQAGDYDDVISRLGPRLARGADDATGAVADRPRMSRILAEAKLQSGDTAGAMEILRPLLSEGIPQPELRLLFARVLLAGGEHDAAHAQVDRLLELDPPPVAATLMRAREKGATGDSTSAIELLRAAQRRHDLGHAERQEVVALLAKVLHDTGQYQASWELCLGLTPRTAEVVSIREEAPLQLVANEPAESAMSREVAWAWPPQPPQDGRTEPVFVFGWPGSGRDALLQALSQHSSVCLVTDRTESQTSRRLTITHPQGRGPLNALTAAEIQLARRKYWKAVRQLEQKTGSVLTIDALWLTAESLPTLYRLFPQSHLVVLEHEPKDMALGWLQAGYRDLESMAAVYRQQLSLLKACRQGVPLNYVDVDASRLRAESGTVLREVVSALGLAWEAAVEKSFEIGITADFPASGSSVHYADWLDPVYEVLSQ